jgi:hypothetical protein
MPISGYRLRSQRRAAAWTPAVARLQFDKTDLAGETKEHQIGKSGGDVRARPEFTITMSW